MTLGYQRYIIGLVGRISQGHLFESGVTDTVSVGGGEISYMKFFMTKFTQSKRALLWMVGVERVPDLNKFGQVNPLPPPLTPID
jgi:hypothetical protein